MRKRRIGGILLIAVMVLSGCSTKPGNTIEEPREQPAAEVLEIPTVKELREQQNQEILDGLSAMREADWTGLTQEQMEEDFDYLYHVINENYPYFGVVQRVTGNDLHALYAESREKIQACQSDMEFLILVQEYVNYSKGAGHFSTTWYEPGEKDSPVYPKVYELAAPVYQEARANYDRALNGNSPMDQNVTTRFLEDYNAAYVNIKAFDMDLYDQDEEILLDFYRQAAQCDNLIIDISQNGGGGMFYYWKLIVGPNIDEPIITVDYMFEKGGMLNAQRLSQWEESYEKNYIPISDAPEEHWEVIEENVGVYGDVVGQAIMNIIKEMDYPPPHMNQQDMEDMDYYSIAPAVITPKGTGKIFGGKIWVLVSDAVYSSSESFANMCKQTGFATLVGTQTGGDGIGSNPVLFSLPNSGIALRYAPAYGTTPDGWGSEEFGTTPDIISLAGESPLDTCLRVISQ